MDSTMPVPDGDDQTATKSQDGQQKLDQAAFPTTDVDVVDPECTKKEREEKHHDRALVSWPTASSFMLGHAQTWH